ncbi:MAG: hypothetical protein M1838_005878 [Thelocarpon superellum]|nr:MAG: hypothetical protein M1838_005878 [Thelocarpon superellum]
MRYLELFVSLLYISVLIYSRAHPGNWNRLDAIVGVGAVITAATWGHIGYGLAVLHRNDSTLVVVSRKAAVLPMEVGAALAWSATGAFMCFPTQGQVDVYANSPPFIAWGFAVVLAFILAVFFLVSAIVGVLLCRAIRWEKESSGWIV